MADIRLARQRGSHIWLITGAFALLGVLFWASAFVIGDRTAPDELPRVGAAADFGGVRAPVIPVEAVPFGTLTPLQTRDLGRFVRLGGVAESRVGANSLWVRTDDGYRILVRFEPEPPAEFLAGVGNGSRVEFNGYLQTIALAEFLQVIDSLNVAIPRPPPGRKFGDLPSPAFRQVDALIIKNYYISVRPEGIRPDDPATASSAA